MNAGGRFPWIYVAMFSNIATQQLERYTYDDLGLGQLSNRNRKLKIAGCVTERYHSFARDFDILRPI